VYRGCTVAVVMPAYNVQDHLASAVTSVPAYVDHLVVVNDGSTDETAAALDRLRGDGRIVRVDHLVNRGVGAAIATGYAASLKLGAQVVAVMAGDGQMDPADLSGVLDPVASGRADYAKGNRFATPEVWRVMPTARLIGNIGLSLLTRLTSGYWRCFDSQCGYTAISAAALRAIDGRIFASYGYPNDILARLRTVGARVEDVPVRPVYDGQPSGIRIWTVIYPILFVLLRSMGRRLWRQRLLPLVLPGSRVEIERLGDADRPPEHLLPAPPR
jgi:glycosyltransferase involved in cell wall biosynthesis